MWKDWTRVLGLVNVEIKVSKELAKNNFWKSFLKDRQIHANMENRSSIKYHDKSAISYDNLRKNKFLIYKS